MYQSILKAMMVYYAVFLLLLGFALCTLCSNTDRIHCFCKWMFSSSGKKLERHLFSGGLLERASFNK
jgi:hypothetical protein